MKIKHIMLLLIASASVMASCNQMKGNTGNETPSKNMDAEGEDFRLTFLVDQSPETVFRAISNVRAWWTGYHAEQITGNTEKLHDEFTYRAGGGIHYSKHKLVEVIPNRRIVWLTTESDLSFIKKKDEWTGTRMIFDISEKGDKTRLTITHEGLTPDVECYDACAPTWTQYIQEKLLPLIQSGQ